MKDADRRRIERCLQDIDTWRASGMKLKAYAQSRGEEPRFAGGGTLPVRVLSGQ